MKKTPWTIFYSSLTYKPIIHFHHLLSPFPHKILKLAPSAEFQSLTTPSTRRTKSVFLVQPVFEDSSLAYIRRHKPTKIYKYLKELLVKVKKKKIQTNQIEIWITSLFCAYFFLFCVSLFVKGLEIDLS